MNEIFPYRQDHLRINISWEHKLLFFQLQEKTLKIKKYEEFSFKSFRRQPNNLTYIYQTLSFDLRTRNSIGIKRRG